MDNDTLIFIYYFLCLRLCVSRWLYNVFVLWIVDFMEVKCRLSTNFEDDLSNWKKFFLYIITWLRGIQDFRVTTDFYHKNAIDKAHMNETSVVICSYVHKIRVTASYCPFNSVGRVFTRKAKVPRFKSWHWHFSFFRNQPQVGYSFLGDIYCGFK